MDLLSPEAKAYLFELYAMTKGDLDAQVSMYDVGHTLGIEKTEAASMAENLYIQGLAELKTLSGGIGITREGLKVLEIAPPPGDVESLSLGNSRVLSDQARSALDAILPELKSTLADARMSYPQIEEVLMDIKTIEVQMLSLNPKTAIVREILRSIHDIFKHTESEEVTVKLQALITR